MSHMKPKGPTWFIHICMVEYLPVVIFVLHPFYFLASRVFLLYKLFYFFFVHWTKLTIFFGFYISIEILLLLVHSWYLSSNHFQIFLIQLYMYLLLTLWTFLHSIQGSYCIFFNYLLLLLDGYHCSHCSPHLLFSCIFCSNGIYIDFTPPIVIFFTVTWIFWKILVCCFLPL